MPDEPVVAIVDTNPIGFDHPVWIPTFVAYYVSLHLVNIWGYRIEADSWSYRETHTHRCTLPRYRYAAGSPSGFIEVNRLLTPGELRDRLLQVPGVAATGCPLIISHAISGMRI